MIRQPNMNEPKRGGPTGAQSPVGRRVILIAGMHRSGTSATARVISLLGGVLPKEVMPPTGWNTAGFWEPATIIPVHEELLEAAGSSWHDTSPLPAAWLESDAARRYTKKLEACLLAEYGDTDLAVVKDPRLCRLMPLWIPLVESLPATPLFVLPYRHPLEVADSLQQRDGFPRQKSFVLWLQHLLLAERATRGWKRVLVPYASLLADPEGTVERITKRLDVEWPRDSKDALAEIEAFLTLGLRNHGVERTAAIGEDSGLVTRAYRLIEENEELPPAALEELDAIREDYLEASRLMSPIVGALESRLPEPTSPLEPDAAAVEPARDAELPEAPPHGSSGAPKGDEPPENGNARRVSRLRAAATVTRLLVSGGSDRLLLDLDHYTALYPEAKLSALGPRLHFAWVGAAKDHSPHLLFDPEYYLAENPEVRASNLSAFEHYVRAGGHEGRRPHPLFDGAYYLESNPGVARSRLNPLAHFLATFRREGIRPHRLFDCDYYRAGDDAVRDFHRDPVTHYLRIGVLENRDPHPLFDGAYYFRNNPDVARHGLNPLVHFVRHGASEGRSPHPLFDSGFYLESRPGLPAPATRSPLEHYLTVGATEGRDPHPLFDTSYYLAKNPDVAAAGMNPLEHFVRFGSAERRPFHPLFDVPFYLERLGEYPGPEDNLLIGYLRALRGGPDRGSAPDPHPLFDSAFYLASNPSAAESEMPPLLHFLRYGGARGMSPHPLFDAARYLGHHPELRRAGANPLLHYLDTGSPTSDPCVSFQTAHYLEQRDFGIEQRLRRPGPESRPGAPDEGKSPGKGSSRDPGPGASARSDRRDTIYAFTSVSLSYLPKARVLLRTLKQQHPEIHFAVMVNEPVPPELLAEVAPFDEFREVEDLPIDAIRSWIFKHSLVELATATKAFYLEELLERNDCRAVLYLDPDIAVFSSLAPVLEALERRSIVLTPHQTEPDTLLETVIDNEICSLKHGVFNLGFLGVRPTGEGKRFAGWWKRRLEHFCYADIPGGLFTDQRWIDLVPCFFDDYQVIRHPGCNVATWNLSHRRVEGSFDEGFTVNGEPLVFYHFSGFDSGAQELMLRKYGSSMPAAFALREWYLEMTGAPRDRELSSRPWAYDCFSNGQLISPSHRRLYRDRSDLQRAFPDPFDTADVALSFRDWHASEAREPAEAQPARNAETASEDVTEETPLAHFLRRGSEAGLRPNPLFDPAFYLRTYPDIERAGVNPLVHYTTTGWKERRAPSRRLDVDFYLEQMAARGVPAANPVEHYLTDGWSTGFRPNQWFDPDRDRGALQSLARTLEGPRPVILHIGHDHGGGTHHHIGALARLTSPRAHNLLLTPSRHGLLRLEPLAAERSATLHFDSEHQRGKLVEVLHDLEVRRLHIHHALGNEDYLEDLVRRLGLPFDFTLHDYYVLSPSPHLTGPDGRYVGDDLEAAEPDLLRNAASQTASPPSLRSWQTEQRWLLERADRVIAASEDTIRRVGRHTTAVLPLLAPHWEPEGDEEALVSPRAPDPIAEEEPLRVLLLGQLASHKGRNVVADVAALVSDARPPVEGEVELELHLIGYLDGVSRIPGLSVVGPYRPEALAALVRDCRPHLIWYPMQWPETYSYTLSEGIRSGYPIVACDLGAFPERLRGRPWTWVVPYTFEPREWLELFREIRRRHLASGVAPERLPGSPPARSFYPDEYLRPAESSTGTGRTATRTDDRRTGESESESKSRSGGKAPLEHPDRVIEP